MLGAQLGGGRQRAWCTGPPAGEPHAGGGCSRSSSAARSLQPAPFPGWADAMNWQPVPRIEQGGQYASHGDPYAMQPGAAAPQVIGAGLSTEEQHFLSSCTTREYEEMARRKAEHMESAEHIAPQHNYPIPGKTSRYACTRMRPPARGRTLTAQLVPRHAAHACGGVTVYKNLSPAARAQHRIQCGRASTSGI